jgi:putative copper export protein
MITLAAANRFALTPLLSQAPDTRRLRISIALEFALGLAVIAAAAFLGSLPPPTG